MQCTLCELHQVGNDVPINDTCVREQDAHARRWRLCPPIITVQSLAERGEQRSAIESCHSEMSPDEFDIIIAEYGLAIYKQSGQRCNGMTNK